MRRSLAVLLAAGALSIGLVPAASADEDDLHEQPEEPDLSSSDFADAVIRYNPADSLITYDREVSIDDLGGGEPEEQNVISLETDILFSPMEWELPGNAGARIADLVEEVPDGAAVDVHGHTDSNPVPDEYDFDNDELSENRAQAVADVLEDERPDLTLNVEGFGDSQPAEAEDPEDPSTFAANRRVEIRHGS
ncbi:OmpA family protein [Nesterenkonia populi]|uniref:OmpA family protein n=1 Tax=Nesterenkonia populi TaxID=1591087 RepID=UPI0011BD484B|nr:OmpA family protein [Nesterenkonia populi]